MKTAELPEYNLLIHEDGTILNTKTGRSLAQGAYNTYQTVSLYSQEPRTRKNVQAHRLIYEAFNGPIPEKHWINHIDGNKSNNTLSNLEVTTPSENHIHAFRVLKRHRARGLDVPHAVLTPEAHEALKILNLKGWSQKKIAAALGVSQCLVSKKIKQMYNPAKEG